MDFLNYLKAKKHIIAIILLSVAVIVLAVILTVSLIGKDSASGGGTGGAPSREVLSWDAPSYIITDLLPTNQYSRPGTELEEVKGIVVHYVANPGTSAKNNRSYFAGLAQSGATYASSHFIIGLEGEVIQCIPADEVAYASNERNKDTLAIECCHPDATGVFAYPTYRSLVTLCADICLQFGLDPSEDIIRHYDVTGKMCPLYFVEHEDEWYIFLDEVEKQLSAGETAVTEE